MVLSAISCNELTSILAEASTSNSKKASGFTVCELVQGLKELLVCDKNVQLLATSNRLCLIFVTLLSCGSIQEQISGCELLWGLTQSDKFKDKLRNNDFPFVEVLKGMEGSEDQTLCTLAACTALALEGNFETG